MVVWIDTREAVAHACVLRAGGKLGAVGLAPVRSVMSVVESLDFQVEVTGLSDG